MKRSNAQPLKEVLEHILDKYRLSGQIKERKAIASWGEIMGTVIARHTTHIYIRNKHMYIHLDSSVLRQELSYKKTEIMHRLNEQAGAGVVEAIVFR